MATDPTTRISVELSPADYERLAAVSKRTGRSASVLAAEAISAYLALDAWHASAIEDAVRAADAGGPFAEHEEIVAWLESWGTDHERPTPSE
jgi:predicted transcriptional regulator